MVRQGGRPPGRRDESDEPVLMEGQAYLAQIEGSLREAAGHLRALFLAIARLELAGWYPALPAEEWRPDDGGGEGLYLHFPAGPRGGYLGPEGQRTLYIGTDPVRIAEARRLAENRRRYELLSAAVKDLDRWLLSYEHQLKVQAIIAKYWPRVEIPEPLPGDVGCEEEGQ